MLRCLAEIAGRMRRYHLVMMRLANICLAGMVLPVLACAQDQSAKAREVFLFVERAARMDREHQVGQIPRLYREIVSTLDRSNLVGSAYVPRPPVDLPGSPEEGAVKLEQAGGRDLLLQTARDRCRALLVAHIGELTRLVEEDLRSGATDGAQRAIRAAGEFRLAAVFDLLAQGFDGNQAEPIAYAMRDINDARGLPFLVDHSGIRFCELLRHLQHGRAADPVLMALTNRQDPDTRRRAAYALAESQDPALAAVVVKLASDESPDVRHEAASMGANLPDAAFREVRPALIRLLSDPVIDVKAYAAQTFAYRKDTVCGEALLQLLADEQKLVNWQQSNTVQAVQNLTGSYFGFQPGTVSEPEARRVSLQKFAAWIRENGAPTERRVDRRQ